jgi:acetoin utilization protein AcuB
MLVKDYMTRHPLMGEPSMSIVDAQRYMAENNIRHLPIVGDGKRLEGLVTRRTLMVDPGRLGSLDVWEISRYLSGLPVREAMVKTKEVITIGPDTPIEEAARRMVENRIGCLPVLEGDVVIGIITETDLLSHLSEMMALRISGVRATVRMPNRHGELAKLIGAIAAQGWGIAACGGVPARKDADTWEAVVKMRRVSVEEAAEVLGAIEGHEVVDVREA